MTTVLITSTGGLGMPSIVRHLQDIGYRVITCDMRDIPIMHELSDGFHIVPHFIIPSFYNDLNYIIETEKVDVVIPMKELLLDINRVNCKVVLNEGQDRFSDKVAVYDELKGLIPVPKYYRVDNFFNLYLALGLLDYPQKHVIVKPYNYEETGGGKRFKVISPYDKNGVSDVARDCKGLMACEYLEGDELSCYCMGEYVVIQKRNEIKNHYSWDCEIVENNQIELNCKAIMKHYGFKYPVNIQFKGGKLVEINPRIGGSVVLSCKAGVDFLYMAIRKAFGQTTTLPKPKPLRMIRYWSEIYI